MLSAGGAAGARIQLRRQAALQGLRELSEAVEAGEEPFDLCFIDADKD
jgi:predicted O-methyltransferase YrrM